MPFLTVKRVAAAALVMLAVSCGGAKKPLANEPGRSHAEGDPNEPQSAWGGKAGHDYGKVEEGDKAGGDATQPAPGTGKPGEPGSTVAPVPPVPPAAPVTFELKNDGKGDLVFAIDRGWQPVLFAFTGKPPKAKSVLLFSSACTMSCDSSPEEMCPICELSDDPKKRKQEELAAIHRETAAEGGSVKVDWDGKIFAYEKAPAAAAAHGSKTKKCQCWRKIDPPPGTYTIKACGLRPSTKAGEPSTPVCTTTEVTLPLEKMPGTISLSFAK